MARNPSKIDAKRGDRFLQADLRGANSEVVASLRDRHSMASHDKDMLYRLGPRILMLEAGHIVFDGTYEAFRHSNSLAIRPYFELMSKFHQQLVNADWPGNIRELENFIERCVILTQGDELNVLRAELKKSSVRSVASAAPSFEQAERQAIIDALIAASGRIAGKGGAAERLGLKRTTLQGKMQKLNVSRADYSQ
jgi:ABC-type sulfate/molybdate transport systems ATPase subunit